MNADKSTMDGVSGRIIGCAFTISNTLGAGFPETVYENALAHEMRKSGLTVIRQRAIIVHYDGDVVGDYTADMLVNDDVMIELKPRDRSATTISLNA